MYLHSVKRNSKIIIRTIISSGFENPKKIVTHIYIY